MSTISVVEIREVGEGEVVIIAGARGRSDA
jgi:hypothetical protein